MFRSYTAGSVIKSLAKYDTVSFDVFDTLIKRCVASPRDVFARTARDFMDIHGCFVDPERFLHDRRTAEHDAYTAMKASSPGCEEITLDQIYTRLPSEYDGIRDELKALEIRREVKCARPDPAMKEVYRWCRDKGRRVFIISDMYLPGEVIREILTSCGYEGWEKLYVSSSALLRKQSGGLFRHFIRDSGINPKRHVHIGDSWRSDYFRALMSGLHALKIPRSPRRSTYTKTLGLNPGHKAQYRKYESVISGHVPPGCDEYYRYGFEVVGIMLYGLCCWLHERFTEMGHERVFFLSRDGYIMQEAYNMLFGNKAVRNSYLYASRNAFIFPRIWMKPALPDIFESVTPFELIGRDYACDVLHISDRERACSVWKECGFGDGERMSRKQFLSDKRAGKFFEAFRDEVCRESRRRFELVTEYLRQEGLRGSVGIVDIGWACTMQKYLEEFTEAAGIDADIHGWYLGLKPETFVSKNFESYIPAELNPSLFCPSLMEYPFTKNSGSTETYSRGENGDVVPVLYDYEFRGSDDEEHTRQIQKGMLDFISVMRDGYGAESVGYDVAYSRLRKVTKSPSLSDACLLGGLRYVNHGHMTNIAAPRSLIHYVLHPADFKADFSASGWKAGFLRRLMRLPLPYDRMLSFVRRKLERKYT